jgi:hypothetical protein
VGGSRCAVVSYPGHEATVVGCGESWRPFWMEATWSHGCVVRVVLVRQLSAATQKNTNEMWTDKVPSNIHVV